MLHGSVPNLAIAVFPFYEGVSLPIDSHSWSACCCVAARPSSNRQHDRNCRYLDYIEEKKDIGMIIRLYERCLVACASYPGMLRD